MADPSPPATTRRHAAEDMRRRLIEAAIAQLAAEGMRGLTHRKVEHRAGVSQGLAKYHFGSLDGLIVEVLAYLADVELANIFVIASPTHAPGAEQDAITAVLEQSRILWEEVNAHPDLVKAWFELYLFAVHRPDLQDTIRRSRTKLADKVAQSLSGSPDPDAAAKMLLALFDGMLIHQLSAPDETLDRLAPSFMVLAGAASLQLPTSSDIAAPG